MSKTVFISRSDRGRRAVACRAPYHTSAVPEEYAEEGEREEYEMIGPL
jgi:hypothetical protein